MIVFRKYIFLVVSALLLTFTSCRDELFYNPDDYIIGEGNADMNVSVTFRDLEPALESRSAGNAVDKVNSLWVVLYNIVEKDTVFYKKILASGLTDYVIDQTGNSDEPSDAEKGDNLGPTGEKTPKATFTLHDIPYGRYQMYAVANVPDLTDDDCATPDKLRSMTFTWDTDVSKNNAMFGYFTTDQNKSSKGFYAPVLIVNKENLNLHAWIKRLVSKVTISFDATNLKESVRIYIKSVQIHDIPKTCYLGKENKPKGEDELIHNGEEFKYYTEETKENSQHEQWKIVLSRGKEYNLQGAVNHTEEDDALYFFENMQGNYPGQKDYLKVQIADEVGTAIDTPVYDEDGNIVYGDNGLSINDFKDRVLDGTYIEVIGYYESKNKDKLTSGPIIYRFMLGKDITYNYDAERTYHYKLTLKFRGWANEADWHISYREHTPTMLVPEKYYISYLYGQELDFPVRVLTGDEGVKQYTVKAEIIENNWAPATDSTFVQPNEFIGPQTDIDGFAWNKTAYNNIYGKGVNYVGFLSLRPNEGDVIGDNIPDPDQHGYGEKANMWLKDYYDKHNIANNEYQLNGPNTKYDPVDRSVTLTATMYTRQKEMVPQSDFTANNPFNGYVRTAKVRFTLYDEKGEKVDKLLDKDGNETGEVTTTIIQVQRIDNPKAIYRDENSIASFDVKLMYLKNTATTVAEEYSVYRSDGPWRASIMCQTEDFIKLTGDGNQVVNGLGEYITGSTDDPIEFTYKPKSTCPGRTRCGIIKVEYNDHNCVHLIFVRQGYNQGVKLGDANWSCYNVYAAANPSNRDANSPGDNISAAEVALTRSPLSVGSYLKRCQYNYSIREFNNVAHGWLQPIEGVALSCAYIDANRQVQTRTSTWSEIQGYGWTNYGGYDMAERATKRWATTWTAVGGFQDGKKFKVPTAENYNALLSTCKFGYGIAYADGATATAPTFKMANGYEDYANEGKQTEYGVRACVVYDESDGKNILFPLGALGQARRTCSNVENYGTWGPSYFTTNAGIGTLSYPGVQQPAGGTTNAYRPLTFDVYRTPGALYWIEKPVLTDVASNISGVNRPDYASWDINYLTLVFNPYAYNSLSGWNDGNKRYNNSGVTSNNCSDALPIKLIYAQ